MRRVLSKTATYLGYTIQVGCVTHCTFEYLFDFVICNGPSMEPTIFTKDILLTDRISPRIGKITRGDIVIAKNPAKPKQLVCKRVIGTPGDVILAQNVRPDFELMDDGTTAEIHFKKVIIPPGQLWIEGDNSANSSDSRHYGPISRGLIVSRAVFRLFPIQSFGFI